MPYTLLHPGFILPFVKKWVRYVSVPALIVGSIIPDLDIIYRFSETRNHIFTYTLANILGVLVPIGIALTYYLKWITLPILQKGELIYRPSYVKQSLLKIPVIIISLIVAIYLHLFLDNYAHFDDTRGLSLRLGHDLGYEPEETEGIYFLLLYLPQVILSVVGLVLTLLSAYIYRQELRRHCNHIRRNKLLYTVVFGLIFIAFSCMKLIKAGVEEAMFIDSILIALTTGLTSALLFSPILVWALQKISLQSQSLLMTTISVSLFMLGANHKEFLALYILKGLFITLVSYIVFFGVFSNSFSKIRLLLPVVLIFIHPFSSNFSFLFAIMAILLWLYSTVQNKNSLWELVFGSGITAGVWILSFYALDKGLGAGVVVITILSIWMQLHIRGFISNQLSSLTWIGFVFILSILIAHNYGGIVGVHIIASIFLFVLLALKISSIQNVWLNYIRLVLPIVGVLHVFNQVSWLYGVFSLACVGGILLLSIDKRQLSHVA